MSRVVEMSSKNLIKMKEQNSCVTHTIPYIP